MKLKDPRTLCAAIFVWCGIQFLSWKVTEVRHARELLPSCLIINSTGYQFIYEVLLQAKCGVPPPHILFIVPYNHVCVTFPGDIA